MGFLDYPDREPMSQAASVYHARCIELGAGVSGQAHRYGSDPFQSLLVHQSARPNGCVLLFFHGGGWTHGYKEWMSMIAPPLSRRGITVVTAGYRLAPEHIFPSGLDDCRNALGWVGLHAHEIGAESDRIFVGGHSAGGHYASLLALQQQPGASPQIAGCIPVSGVYKFGEGSGLSNSPRFLGRNPTQETCLRASPLHWVHADAPAFFISWGEHDFPHLKVQASEMVHALDTVEVPVRTLELSECDHFGASYATAEPDGAWAQAVVSFMADCDG